MAKKRTLLFLLLIALQFKVSAYYCSDENCNCLNLLSGPYRLGFGPEFYYIDRKSGGNEQDGWMGGGHIFFDRIRPWCVYYGADQYYTVGHVQRKCEECTHKHEICLPDEKHEKKSKRQRKSHLVDAEVDGRIGFTVGYGGFFGFDFTPFVGFGNYNGTNEFSKRCKKPGTCSDCIKNIILNYENPCSCCKLKCKQPKTQCKIDFRLRPRFNYFSAGFISRFFLCENANIGVNFKAKFMTEGRTKIDVTVFKERRNRKNSCDDSKNSGSSCCQDDPGPCKRHCYTCKTDFKFCKEMQKRTMYEVEVPLTYYYCECRTQTFELSIVPFYRSREYGYCDCKKDKESLLEDTKFTMWGGIFLITYLF